VPEQSHITADNLPQINTFTYGNIIPQRSTKYILKAICLIIFIIIFH